jgi:hypothetical protein
MKPHYISRIKPGIDFWRHSNHGPSGYGNVGVTRKYQDIETKAAGIPFVGKSLGLDLDQYVSSKALDGLFFMH